ncbi:hypothetical protein [Halorientalis litorea]|jgi:hypothetical protein|uniref:hypothetical protein n=1 Tax=Halorientalis litorea TaxID=2931977 RepID=UPI001FF2F664|nr:hypothetical protein [Halorientalis litorea]
MSAEIESDRGAVVVLERLCTSGNEQACKTLERLCEDGTSVACRNVRSTAERN